MTTMIPAALRCTVVCLASLPCQAQRPPAFERHRLSETFYCEGAGFCDVNRDGHGDVISGPNWYAGPDFADKHEIYPRKAFDPARYSDNFFAFPYDFDGDGWVDILFVGFPGQAAHWYRNPQNEPGLWERHLVFETVDNESPTFTDLTGDGEPELVFHSGGRFGWAGPDPENPNEPWAFHPVSAKLEIGRFTHGLGVGDVDGDGDQDILWKKGWLENDPEREEWAMHDVDFAAGRIGGAQMFVLDVDGDSDPDVVTSLHAHGWGLSWFEQTEPGKFREQRILDEEVEPRVSELHALDLADVNGDGLLDFVSGKRFWSHGAQGDPGGDERAGLYWFELVRAQDGTRFVPHLIDADSGVGTQVVCGDVDGDGRADVVVGNKQGTYVFLQREDAEPAKSSKPDPGVLPGDENGRPLNFDFEQGDLRDWKAEGDAFDGQPVRGDTVAQRLPVRSRHQGDYWIGGYELHKDVPQGRLTSVPFRVTHPWASFLLGGGSRESTRVELAREGEAQPFFTISGPSYEPMQRVVCDLRERLDQHIVIRLVDENPGGWGHVNFDDFRFHEHEPTGFGQPEGVPKLLPADRTAFAGLTAQEAAAAMTVPDGFKVDVIAAEPDVHQPIAFTIDAKGRLWVAEAHSYPVRRPEGEGLDKILVLADEDNDGSFETRTVFAEGLNLVSGLEVGFGGVWVGAAPYLLFIPDRDGDLVPDGEPEILLDGWGYEDTHETLNAFIWGPDGWLYGCHGVFTHSRVGKPGTPDDGRVPINAGVWRYHPTRHEFEVFAWGSSNPWGVDFDDKGQAFITACVIPHLFHVIQGGRYERQAGRHFNPYVYEDIGTIADHLHWQGETPWVGNQRSGAVGGGHAHCGAMIYLGDSFPESYRGKLFMNNIHGNRVNVDSFERNGSGFVAHHEDDFLLANDKWFRGINLKYGPDGSVYLIDWYDEQACHTQKTEIWDRTNGRIYRVSYGDYRPIEVDLRSLSDDELCELQLHANDWYVRRARLVLQERGPNPKVHQRLKAILRDHPQESRKLRALWALHVTGGTTPKFLVELKSPHEYVRAWAIQLASESGFPALDLYLSIALTTQSQGSSSVFAMYLASAMQRVGFEGSHLADPLLASEEHGDDPNIPLLVWYAIEPWVAKRPDWALGLLDHSRIETVNRFIIRRIAENPDQHALLTSAIAKEEVPKRIDMMLEAMDTGLRGQRNLEMPEGWPELYADLSIRDYARYRNSLINIAAAFGDAQAFGELRGVLRDADRDLEVRERALEALARGKDVEAVPALQSVLAEPGLRGAAIRALSNFDDAHTPAAILAHYGEYTGDEKRDCLNTLSERASYARELLGAVERGEVPSADLQAFVLRKLRALEDEEVDRLMLSAWGVFKETAEDKAEQIAELKADLNQAALATADLSQGRAVFEKTCMQCHELFGQGGDLGPGLTGSNRADLDYLLENMVDPSAVIGRDYQVTMVWTHDERLVTGILSEETDSAVTLRTENDTVVVPTDEIAEQRLSELSTMPEGQLETLSKDEIVALVAYLASPEQVPLVSDPESAGELFNGSDLTGWHGNPECWSVEAGEIVGLTPGLARNEFLKSTRELSDFRLTLEVRLKDNAGNSGIQFRSRELAGGDVAGYQADIGAGWWGKLYEEHGRAVLWERSGEAHVAPDEWNTYTIEAVGPRLRTWLNGQLCVDLEDDAGAASGIIALQLHSGGPTEVRFRNLRLELDPQPREDSR